VPGEIPDQLIRARIRQHARSLALQNGGVGKLAPLRQAEQRSNVGIGNGTAVGAPCQF
jgi:hypothetical protein